MEVLHSLQGHPLSGKQWMETTDETSIDDLEFSTTTHDGHVCKRGNLEGTALTLRQVDDSPIGTTSESTVKRVTRRFGERVKSQHKEDPRITFLGLINNSNGVDIKWLNNLVLESSKGCVEQMLQARGWGTGSNLIAPNLAKMVRPEEVQSPLSQHPASHKSKWSKASKKTLLNTPLLRGKWDSNTGPSLGN